jgi:hypothetical protein
VGGVTALGRLSDRRRRRLAPGVWTGSGIAIWGVVALMITLAAGLIGVYQAPSGVARHPSRHGFSVVPTAAQGPISSAMGANEPEY